MKLPPVLRLAQVISVPQLRAAWQATYARGPRPGPDGVTAPHFALDADARLEQLARELLAGQYRPRPAWRVWVAREHGPPRGVVALSVVDRIVEGALLSGLRVPLEARLHPAAFAYRPGLSTLRAAEALALQLRRLPWVVRGDVEACFESVPHGPLLLTLAPLLDPDLLALLQRLLARPVLEHGRTSHMTCGVAQGSLLAPLLANWYLTPFDKQVSAAGGQLVRYADDFTVVADSPAAAGHLAEVASGALQTLGLRLNPRKSRIVSVSEGVEMLGFQFRGGDVRIAPGRCAAFQQQVTALMPPGAVRNEAALRAVNDLIRGWQAYFRLGNVHLDLQDLDRWLAAQYPGQPLARLCPGVRGGRVAALPGAYVGRAAVIRAGPVRPPPSALLTLRRAALQEIAALSAALPEPAYGAAGLVAIREQQGQLPAGSAVTALCAAHRTMHGPAAPLMRAQALEALEAEAAAALETASLPPAQRTTLAPALAALFAPRTVDAVLGVLLDSPWPPPIAVARRLDSSVDGPLTLRVLLHREAGALQRAQAQQQPYRPWTRP